jgi:nitroimidazol reductase NimA-like FMN-containing flavoprotein (pyridoxamine 5'-phosphate oxidase superfamily)
MESDIDLNQATLERTERSRLRRHPERGLHERAAAEAILDEALFCHVAVSIDGAAHVLPTAHARVGDVLYFHGARKNHLLAALVRGAQACVTVTLLDGLVFARSAFSHSVNFRSLVLYGVGSEVQDSDEKRRALAALIEHMARGRSTESRAPSDDELKQTLVVRFPIGEGAVKLRQGPPLDAEREPQSPHWAGVLPLRLVADAPLPDPLLGPGITMSSAVAARAQAMLGNSAYEVRRDALCISTD